MICQNCVWQWICVRVNIEWIGTLHQMCWIWRTLDEQIIAISLYFTIPFYELCRLCVRVNICTLHQMCWKCRTFGNYQSLLQTIKSEQAWLSSANMLWNIGWTDHCQLCILHYIFIWVMSSLFALCRLSNVCTLHYCQQFIIWK